MQKDVDVIIIGGFGHVGLPLGIVLADCGLKTLLLDINTALRPTIEAGKMPFIEYDSEPILQRVIGKKLFVADGMQDVARAKTIIVTIGTPVDEYLSPKTRPMFDLFDQILSHLQDDQCVVLRSTVTPGMSTSLVEYVAKKGKTLHLAYCPERIVQGYAIRELTQLPQVISGSTPKAIRTAKEVFEALGVETIEVGLAEAEMTKLYLNAWRYIQFAVGNQFYLMAQEKGLDYRQIYHAMTHHYERGKGIPRPGFAAGPCLLKDTMQLAAAGQNQFLLGYAAMMVNEGLPGMVVDRLCRERGIELYGKTVGILGMAFKADIDDTRDSLSFKLRKILRFHGADVVCSDEFVQDGAFVSKEKLVDACDIIIIGVPHKAYAELRIPKEKIVMDIWGILSS